MTIITDEDLPVLDETNVAALATKKVIARGRKLLEEDALTEMQRQGYELAALCQGSEVDPYEVSAELSKTGIVDVECTCPYEGEGICKHAVALLLAWIHTPEVFSEVAPTRAKLEQYSREKLIDLLEICLQQEPRLRALLQNPTDQHTDDNLTLWRNSIRAVLKRASSVDWGYAPAYTPYQLSRELQKFCKLAVAKGRTSDGAQSCAMCTILLSELTSYYPALSNFDEQLEIAACADDICEGIAASLPAPNPKSPQHAQIRRGALDALLDAALLDLRIGGIGYADDGFDIVLSKATGDEWDFVEQRIRAELKSSQQTSMSELEGHEERFDSWAREYFVKMLTEIARVRGEGDKATQLIYEMGTPQQKAFLLISEGRIDEAMKVARAHFIALPGVVLDFTEALLKQGAVAQARHWMQECVERAESWNSIGYAEWLAEHYESSGESSEVVKWREHIWTKMPSVANYDALKAAVMPLNTWDSKREKTLADLKKRKSWLLLLDIALQEKDAAAALSLLPKLKSYERSGRLADVATGLEKEQPEAALSLWLELVEKHIEQRDRSAYHVAARILGKIKKLYDRLKQQHEWNTYIRQLREKYKTLRAFQDELNKANL